MTDKKEELLKCVVVSKSGLSVDGETHAKGAVVMLTAARLKSFVNKVVLKSSIAVEEDDGALEAAEARIKDLEEQLAMAITAGKAFEAEASKLKAELAKPAPAPAPTKPAAK